MALFIVILLAIVQVVLAWMGIELAMNPPDKGDARLKLQWRIGFLSVALVGVGLAFWQYKAQERTEEKRDTKLDTIDTRTSNTYDFMVRIYDNTAPSASMAALPVGDTNATISSGKEAVIASELLGCAPLETKIWVDSQEPRAKALGKQIKDVFVKGGFTTAQVVDKPNFGWWSIPVQWVTTNGIQIVMQENPEPSLQNTLKDLNLSIGSVPTIIAGKGAPAQLLVIVRNQ